MWPTKQVMEIDFLLVLLLASRANTRPELRVRPSLCLRAVRLLFLSAKISFWLCVQRLIWCLCPTFGAKERETLTRSLVIQQSINMRSRCLTRPPTPLPPLKATVSSVPGSCRRVRVRVGLGKLVSQVSSVVINEHLDNSEAWKTLSCDQLTVQVIWKAFPCFYTDHGKCKKKNCGCKVLVRL